MRDDCPYCHGCRWVSEEEPTRPWAGVSDHPDAHDSAAGEPCELCNPCSDEDPPDDPPGLVEMMMH